MNVSEDPFIPLSHSSFRIHIQIRHPIRKAIPRGVCSSSQATSRMGLPPDLARLLSPVPIYDVPQSIGSISRTADSYQQELEMGSGALLVHVEVDKY